MDAGVDRFASGVMTALVGNGYVDSHFLSHDGNRLYFMYTPWNLSAFISLTPPGTCTDGPNLVGHHTAPGLEWVTDLYMVQWDGSRWSTPQNLGPNINTLGLECCIWVNHDETEIIFVRTSDLDGDGTSGDLGLPVSGNYRSTRPNKNAPWGPATIMEGSYGALGHVRTDAGIDLQTTDLHKAPSSNLYGWETDAAGNNRLIFGQWTGTAHLPPTLIPGTEHEDTQVWVSDDETVLLYNHRTPTAQTTLRTMTRASMAQPWSSPTTVTTQGFTDAAGATIWGEATFTVDGSQMLFIRFNTSDPMCWRSEIMRARGDMVGGYATPNALN